MKQLFLMASIVTMSLTSFAQDKAVCQDQVSAQALKQINKRKGFNGDSKIYLTNSNWI